MKQFSFLTFLALLFSIHTTLAQVGECTGSSTVAVDGEFTLGYNYTFTTFGSSVNIIFQLLDQKDGLVAFAQTYNPDFLEIQMTQIGAPSEQTFSITYVGQDMGEPFNMACKFAFAGGLATTPIFTYIVGEGCDEGGGNEDGISFPVTFEENIDYGLVDFGGNASEIVTDPTDPMNNVVRSIKTEAAELWAGTTLAEVIGFAEPFPFTPGSTLMTVRVWSPLAGVPIRLKAENLTNPTQSVETEAVISVAGEWQTLTFNFANQAPGTAAINYAFVYDKVSIFFNFGTPGSVTGEQTYYWDDVNFGGGSTGAGLEFPVTFEESIEYGIADFGGNASEIVADPTDPSNTVVRSIKTAGAEVWAGTVLGDMIGFAEPFPFEPGSTAISVRVWSPQAGMPVLLKAEALFDPGVSVETITNTTVAGDWQTLSFDFANHASGTPPINYAANYEKFAIFFNFGTSGAAAGELTFYWDDVDFGGGAPPADPLTLPVDFEDDINYGLVDFGGNISQRVTDPTNANNMVVQSIKTAGAELWAGTTLGEFIGFAEPFPFAPGATTMSVRVWSPLAGIPVRLKAENLTDPTQSVETEAMIGAANVWQTLVFDFANQASGTAAINYAFQYRKVSIFFNFGTPGSASGEQTYYWDDVEFGSGSASNTVYDIIANSTDHTVLASLIDLAQLDGALSGAGPFTVFAPTDAAFAMVPAELLATLADDPSGALTQVLLYHVLGSVVLSGDLSDGQEATTLQGEDITISIQGINAFVNDALISAADILADNGVVHVIDGVLLPPSFTINVNDANSAGVFRIFPNPTADVLQIELSAPGDVQQLRIFDITGRMVKDRQLVEQITYMDVSALKAGTYIVSLQNGKKVSVSKLVVTR